MVDTTIVNIPIKNGQVDISSFLEGKRHAVMIASDEEEIRRLFNISLEKEAFANAMVAAAKARNDNSITFDIALKATEKVYDEFFVFSAPPEGFDTKLKNIYMDRAKVIYKPLMIVGVSAGVISAGLSTINYIRDSLHEAKLAKEEKNVEKVVDDLLMSRSSLENQVKEISTYISEKKPVDSDNLENKISIARDHLLSTDNFFTKYNPSESQVTRENYNEVEKNSNIIKDTLTKAEQQINEGKEIIRIDKGLITVKSGLDSLINEVKSAKPVKAIMDKADIAYQSGISSVENRRLTEAEKYMQQLSQIKSDAHQFALMPAELDRAYQSVINIVQHPQTKEWAEKMYSDGKTYIQNVDIPNLKQTTQDLSEKAVILSQEYEIFIVREKGRTVWDIEWYQTQNGREKITRVDFFARCQAKKNGHAIPVTFYDVGTDKTVTATTFGYRISGDELNGISDDAMMEEFKVFVGSGKYQKTPLAVKKKGFPDEEVKYNSSTAHKILPFSDKTSMVPNN